MCGIAGLVNLSGRLTRDQMKELALRMAGRLAHRGPDDEGVWIDPSGTVALSQRRLSILDLSPAGHQPMLSENGQQVLTFNGEIYNYADIRKSLSERGRRFYSTSDTEVLLKGLIDKGPSFTNELDGMFAFGFYDIPSRTLTLARDIFGEKPLYYAQTKDWFAFASELHALTLLPGFTPHIDDHRIATYLALQYLPAPLTIYTTAHKLPPGHLLTLSPDGRIDLQRYFKFKASGPQASLRSLDDQADELEAILGETVRSRLLTADVPVGAFLSSGVDSSTVVALAMKHVRQPIRTFSIGFREGLESEHEDADAMARHLGTEHICEILPPDFFKTREHLAAILDEPNGDSSCLPTWAVSRTARRSVTVALSGDGGDELFGGYNRYMSTLQDEAENGASEGWSLGTSYYSHRMMIFVDATLEKFIGPLPEATRALLRDMRVPLNRRDRPALHLMRESDTEYYLPGDILAKVDRMSMQHALEVRSPFLGRKVADFAMTLAADDLCTQEHSKRLLKQVAARYIPREWIERRKKGFSIPLTDEWGGPDLAQELETLLLSPGCRLAAWITSERLARFVAFHKNTPNAQHMWPVYILEQWLRTHAGTP